MRATLSDRDVSPAAGVEPAWMRRFVERAWRRRQAMIALLAVAAIAVHLVLRFGFGGRFAAAPLFVALALGGLPLVAELAAKLLRREFGSDLLAGISIVTAVLLGEYLAGTLVVLMLSGGEALEAFAVRNASAALRALAKRMPSVAHVKTDGHVADVSPDEVRVGDTVVVFPHEACPVDGTVVEGHGSMDESYLTGEPYRVPKAPGTAVLSGAVNGEAVLAVRADRPAADSRYARIIAVMQKSQQERPRLRRLGDKLGAFYTPLALVIAGIAWAASGEPLRFLAVLVVATPCPLLIAIPVAVIGAISLAARRGIVIKDPVLLETIDTCRTAVFDKTGTLTFGRPKLTERVTAEGADADEVLRLAAALERYSKHPLAGAVLEAAGEAGLAPVEATEVSERPGEGLRGTVAGRDVRITGRKAFAAAEPGQAHLLPPPAGGLECVVLLDGRYAATLRFRDEPRPEGRAFIGHLGPRHRFRRVMLVSGDRESEARYLAEKVGIAEVHAGQTPEQKVEIVRREAARTPTAFFGDGVNDAPAMLAATAGVAFGQASDVTAEAAGAVILDSSLVRADELLHIGRRMRRVALESAVGGMAASLIAMGFAAAGLLPPVAGAVVQELIDLAAVTNALRAAFPPRWLSDVGETAAAKD